MPHHLELAQSSAPVRRRRAAFASRVVDLLVVPFELVLLKIACNVVFIDALSQISQGVKVARPHFRNVGLFRQAFIKNRFVLGRQRGERHSNHIDFHLVRSLAAATCAEGRLAPAGCFEKL